MILEWLTPRYICGSFHAQFTPRHFVLEKNMFCRVLCSKIIDSYFFFQYDIWKFREMNYQNFEIGKIDVLSIEYSKKSFLYKKLLSYGKCAKPPQLFKVMCCTSWYFFFFFFFFNNKIEKFYKQLSFFWIWNIFFRLSNSEIFV